VVDSLAPRSITVVVLMGLAARQRIAERLLERGWPRATPAAVLWGASRPGAWTWRGELHELGAAAAEGALADAPATIVVGEVVSLAAALAPEIPGPAVPWISMARPHSSSGGRGAAGEA
jgi:uroporphyrin-III C-methyltransferase/precorrin-2 dehydrogenase/sirohydrochlorin ferrochelatase